MENSVSIYILNEGKCVKPETSNERITRCVKLFSGLAEVPDIIREEHKKPRFQPDIGIYFSVSHSKNYWFCAVSRTEIGIDIQHIGSIADKQKIAKRFFHKDEYEYLKKNEFKEFYSVWTAKESYVKYTGQGITDSFAEFSVADTNGIVEYINAGQIKFLDFDENYRVCLCAKKEIGVIKKCLLY